MSTDQDVPTMEEEAPKNGPRPGRLSGIGEHRAALSAMIMGLLMVAAPLALASTAQAQSGCQQDGYNIECNEFGAIRMPTKQDVKGSPVTATADIVLETGYEDQNARWIMFSMRNVTQDGDSPVTISLKNFSSPSGEVVTTQVVQDEPSELNLWVDVLDLPTGEVITLEAEIGVTERGAFSLETVVIPFDRGYEPIKDRSGEPVSLYSSTLLGVNEETSATTTNSGSSLIDGNKLPGATAGVMLASLAVGAGLLARGRKR